MKAKILACAAILFSISSFAQNDTTESMDRNRYDNRTDSTDLKRADSLNSNQWGQTGTGQTNQSHPDGIMMQNGKMMIFRNGNMSAMNRDTTLSNGTVIMRNGNVIMKDGTKKALKEGEHIDMSGQMVPKIPAEGNKVRTTPRDTSNKVRTPRDTTHRKKDMYLVPDSAKKHYEKK